MHLDVDPKMAEFHKLFAQIDILQKKFIKISSRDTLICERGLGILTLSSNSQCALKVEIKLYCAGHRKNIQQQKPGFAGPWFHGENKFF